MTVYVLLHGEISEGGSVVSVHASEAGAVAAAMSEMDGGDFVEDGYDPRMTGRRWTDGCDWFSVRAHEVQL
jgi:hypothetical protein